MPKIRTIEDVWNNPIQGDEIVRKGILHQYIRFGGLDNQRCEKEYYNIYDIYSGNTHYYIEVTDWIKLRDEGFLVLRIEQRGDNGEVLLFTKVSEAEQISGKVGPLSDEEIEEYRKICKARNYHRSKPSVRLIETIDHLNSEMKKISKNNHGNSGRIFDYDPVK